ncbi:hypothetical protein Trydic_g12825 [Trypoxylus dichotomus]
MWRRGIVVEGPKKIINSFEKPARNGSWTGRTTTPRKTIYYVRNDEPYRSNVCRTQYTSPRSIFRPEAPTKVHDCRSNLYDPLTEDPQCVQLMVVVASMTINRKPRDRTIKAVVICPPTKLYWRV